MVRPLSSFVPTKGPTTLTIQQQRRLFAWKSAQSSSLEDIDLEREVAAEVAVPTTCATAATTTTTATTSETETDHDNHTNSHKNSSSNKNSSTTRDPSLVVIQGGGGRRRRKMMSSSSMNGNSSNSSNNNNSNNNSSHSNGNHSSLSAKRSISRSESRAYPNANTSTMLSTVQYHCRQNSRPVLATLAFCFLVVLITSDKLFVSPVQGAHLRGGRGSSSLTTLSSLDHDAAAADMVHWGGAMRRGYFVPAEANVASNQFRFAAVTDLDELSRVPETKKPEFYSILVTGTLTKTKDHRYLIDLHTDRTRTLTTKHNEAGRGAEFSELTIYENRLLTFDDRTGDVFEILNAPDGNDSYVVPRFVITEGNGETDKGMKWEWATVKDGLLYMGSMGKEYTLSDGTIKNRNNLWIGILNQRGELRREDWTKQYNIVRKALGASYPGYIIVEAANWSHALQKWVFLPRRISAQAYDENTDEQKGGHQLVLLEEDFTNPQVVDIKMESLDPLKGFSTFAFVPNSGDRHVLAIRSVEENCVDFTPQCEQRSYFLVFDILTGEVLSEEMTYPGKVKFEGVEFVNMQAVPPPPALE